MEGSKVKRSLSVIHVSTALTWRGGEQQIAYLLQGLEALEVHSHLLCAEGSKMQQYALGHQFAMDSVRKAWSFNPFFARKLANLASSGDFDLVHLHDAHAHNFGIMAADLFRMKLPMVLSRRVDFPIKSNRYSHYKYNHSSIAAILCVSDEIKRVLAPDIRDKSVLNTVYSGIDFARFDRKTQSKSGANRDLRAELGLKDNCRLVGNVAALAPHKDLETFVKAAREMLLQRPNLHFVLLGEGSERAKISQLIQTMDLENHISLLGFRSDVATLLPQLDLMMVSSKTEGLGTSILDAFYCRVPVVATAAGGIKELVLQNQTGLIVDVGNPEELAKAAIRMLSENEMRQRLTTEAYRFCEQFHYGQTARKTLRRYRQLIGV